MWARRVLPRRKGRARRRLISSASARFFDLTTTVPPQRYFRARQAGAPIVPALDAHLIPALTLTGAMGSTARVEGINQFGPTDAWFALDTVTLTNTAQLYFDVSVIGQPPRLWRLIQILSRLGQSVEKRRGTRGERQAAGDGWQGARELCSQRKRRHRCAREILRERGGRGLSINSIEQGLTGNPRGLMLVVRV